MPAAIYYVPCQEPGCWALFKTKEQVPFDPICRLHGCQLIVTEVMKGFVTEFEANQGWTKQRPD